MTRLSYSDLSDRQKAAVSSVQRWLEDGDEQVYRLFGYAGTGKTSIAKLCVEGLDGIRPLFCAFTGKAAHVLRTRNDVKANTIHSLIYIPIQKSLDRLERLEKRRAEVFPEGQSLPPQNILDELDRLDSSIEREKANLRRPKFKMNFDSVVSEADVVIVDECSMIGRELAKDLLSFGTRVLALGDPGQLPPVKDRAYFTPPGQVPDFELTEIFRQEDEPLIGMANDVRLGKFLRVGSYGDYATVHRNTDVLDELAPQADQIICGKNDTRHEINSAMREMYGREGDIPVAGDRLVCLKNDPEQDLLNGQIWIVTEDAEYETKLQKTYTIMAFNEDAPEVPPQKIVAYVKPPEVKMPGGPAAMDYGYALTCHKAQGSQWNHVVVVDESYIARKDKNRWLYTAVTRAQRRVDIVKT